ncbi:hypothetical protein SAY87_009728 [Trapa incisa]|uniref:Putative gamma-glutamylcyclotransferase n=1 Tax=Trapa incisa TaxID=236973 RepID=A0AAN7PY43_9MYRT|nr:hypothetical protein SAY87_009728 [Trapa incisa]
MEACNVFVYGTLIADDVVRILLKRVPPSSPAILHGYHRFSIKGRVYPAILPVDKKSVTGKVLMGITGRELDILDAFEDVEYERRDVEVALVESSEKLQAAVYVWGNSSDPDLHGEWDFEISCSARYSSIFHLCFKHEGMEEESHRGIPHNDSGFQGGA